MRRMNGIPGGKGLMALENEELSQEEGADLGEAADSLETDLIEVNDEQVEGDEHEAEVEEAADAAEALEAIALSLESIAQEGGLDKNGAIMMQHAVQAQYARVGLVAKPACALESFGGTSSRAGATSISLEDIKANIKKIWDAIIANIKKAIEWVKERFMKIFGAANKLEARAKALVTKAGDTTGSPKERSFENERLVKSLHVGGAVNAVQASAELKSTGTQVFGGLSSWTTDAADSIAELLENPEKGSATVPDLKVQNFAPTDVFGEAGEGMKFLRSAELPGNVAIIARIPEKVDGNPAEVADKLARTSIKVGQFDPKAKDPSKKDVAVLSPNDAEKVAQAVADLAVEIQGYKRIQGKLDSVKKRIVNAAEKAGRESGSAEGDKKSQLQANQKLGQAIPRIVDGAAPGFSAYALNTGKALLDYVELSLKQYGE